MPKSTEAPRTQALPEIVESPLTMKELTTLLIKHYGLTAGRFDLMVEYQFGTGAVGPDANSQMPGIMIGMKGIGLAQSPEGSLNAVDAAVVNPATPKGRKKASM